MEVRPQKRFHLSQLTTGIDCHCRVFKEVKQEPEHIQVELILPYNRFSYWPYTPWLPFHSHWSFTALLPWPHPLPLHLAFSSFWKPWPPLYSRNQREWYNQLMSYSCLHARYFCLSFAFSLYIRKHTPSFVHACKHSCLLNPRNSHSWLTLKCHWNKPLVTHAS